MVVHAMFVLFAVFAFIVYAVFFSVMEYIRSKTGRTENFRADNWKATGIRQKNNETYSGNAP